jgi:hypothetical protein
LSKKKSAVFVLTAKDVHSKKEPLSENLSVKWALPVPEFVVLQHLYLRTDPGLYRRAMM